MASELAHGVPVASSARSVTQPDWTAALRRAGLRVTKQRLAVLDALQDEQCEGAVVRAAGLCRTIPHKPTDPIPIRQRRRMR